MSSKRAKKMRKQYRNTVNMIVAGDLQKKFLRVGRQRILFGVLCAGFLLEHAVLFILRIMGVF